MAAQREFINGRHNMRSLYDEYGVVATGDGSDPGTVHTAAIETVDNDVAGVHGSVLELSMNDPRPRPGSAMTATIETTDEDAAGAFIQIGAEWATQPLR